MPGDVEVGWGVPTEGPSIVTAQRKDLVLDSYTNGLLYLQLETELKQKMLTGEYAVGERIPTEPELCDEYGVSRITVRRAVQDLVDEGLLKKVRGRGTFVAVPKYVMNVGSREDRSFEDLTRQGMETSYEIVESKEVPANASVAYELGVDAGEPLLYFRRLVMEGEVPMAIDDLFVTKAEFPGLGDLMDEATSFYSIVENNYGYRFGSEDLTLEASTTRNDEARLLRCTVGAPLFVLRKRVTRTDGRPMHYSKSVIRADRISYRFRVNYGGSVPSDRDGFLFSTAVECSHGVEAEASMVSSVSARQ